MPKEGLVGWLDSFVVPKGAANVETTKKFIDFMSTEETRRSSTTTTPTPRP